MGCLPVRVDNPQALASGLSYVQVDKHGITIYTSYISVDLAHHEIFRAKVGKGGIKCINKQTINSKRTHSAFIGKTMVPVQHMSCISLGHV